MSKIEWCDLTLNPFVGCSHCSPGCENCYAELMAFRLAQFPNASIADKYSNVVDKNRRWTGKISKCDISCFDKLPRCPKRVFIGSMADFFHENANLDDQIAILNKVSEMPQHTFMFLTKRPVNALEMVRAYGENRLPQNAWIGVTICTQQEAHAKLPFLLKIPATKRFISVEPMLEEITIPLIMNSLPDWVICGAETGSCARTMNLSWARCLRDQCAASGIPFFFKKAGNRKPIPDDLMVREFPR